MKTRFLAFGYVVVFACAVWAQSFRGGVQGTVTDSSGANVPGATVTVTSPETGLSRTVTTDQYGNYSATELPIGSYSISVSKAGFRTQTTKSIRIDVSALVRINAVLVPGEVKETIEVSADIPLVETASNTMGGTIEGERAEDLPVNGRDFTKLLVLVPGATGDPSGGADSPGSFGLFSINGNRGRSNNYLLDGTDMNDGFRNLPAINQGGVFGTPATVLPVDALAEVPVLSAMEPEYGRNSGAVVNLVTKSGTNVLHGSLYEFFRNSALDARNYFNVKGQPQNAFHNNQFGGSLGGPIIKDNTFFFFSYEGQRENGAVPAPGTIPTQDEVDAYVAGGGTINPVIQDLLDLQPWGPLPQSNGEVTLRVPFTNRIDSLIAKIDHHIGTGDLLTGRYFFGDSDQSFPLSLQGGGFSPGYNTVTPTRVQIASLSYTHILSPMTLVEFRGGWNRFAEDFFPEDSGFDPNTIGLRTLPDDASSRVFGLPQISVSGYNTLGATTSVPRGRVDTNTQFFTNMSYTPGKHNWKYGFEFRRTSINSFFDAGYRGRLTFDSLTDFLAGSSPGGRSARGNSDRHTYQNSYAFYGQDTWRITPKLILNYGLRWDYFGVITEKDNLMSILEGNGANAGLVQVGTNGLDELYPKDLNNFAPRLSIAYDLMGNARTVLRAGWGVFYDVPSQDFFLGQLPWNTFNPGPAYNGVGPAPIEFSFSFLDGLTPQIEPNQPVYVSYVSSDVFTVDQNLRTPYIQVYNVNLEQALGNNASFQVGYVGSAGRKLFRYRDINQFDPDLGDYPFPNFTYVNKFESTAASNYNSLQVALNFRNFHRFTSTTNYTWSHSIDNASDGQDYIPNASQPDDSRDPDRERASSNFDTRHRLTWNFGYEFPGSGRLWGGWAVNTIVTLASGQPVNVNWINNFNNDFNGTGEFYGRPDLVGDPFEGTNGRDRFLNLAAFAVPCDYDIVAADCSGNQHIGNLGRNAFTGPNYRNWDFSISKTTRVTERVNAQFRVDFFNILNHPNFANPIWQNFFVDMTQNGIDANGRGVDFLGLTQTPDVGLGNPFLGGGGPRNIQLALKFTF
jgi:outer membrane receptor protein involved in Fe transport